MQNHRHENNQDAAKRFARKSALRYLAKKSYEKRKSATKVRLRIAAVILLLAMFGLLHYVLGGGC